MAKKSENANTSTIKLDDLTKAIAFLVGLLYVVGVLATNTYLYSIGVSDFSLLEAQYIYTGLLALAPIIGSLLLPALGIHYFRFKQNLKAPESRSWLGPFTALMNSRIVNWELLILGLGGPFVIFFSFTRQNNTGIIDSILQAFWMYLLSFGGGSFGTMAIAAILPEKTGKKLMDTVFPWTIQAKVTAKHNSKSISKNTPPSLITGFALALFCVGYFAYYLSLFDDYILTKVPEQFGGAEPHQAQLLFHSEAVTGALELGIEIPTDKTISEELTVLYESEKVLVIRLPDEHIIQLSKEMLQAIEIEVSGD